MKTRSLAIRLLACAVCFALVGCSGEPTESPQSSATPSASQTTAAEKTPGPEGQNAGPNGASASTSGQTSGSVDDNRPERTLKFDDDDRTPMTEMSLEPGKERYFQNNLNPAELEYRRKRNEKRARARLEAAEARKQQLNSGNDAPVFDVGGGELTTVNVGPDED